MITFATLLAIAAAVVMLKMWETKNTKSQQPIRVETEEEIRKHFRNRR